MTQHFLKELDALYLHLYENGYNAASITVWDSPINPLVSRVLIFHPALDREQLADFAKWMRVCAEAIERDETEPEQPGDQLPVAQMTVDHASGEVQFHAQDEHFQPLKLLIANVFEVIEDPRKAQMLN